MASVTDFQSKAAYPSVTIASGSSTSAVVDLHGSELCGVFLPSTFDGTALKLQAAPAADGTFVTVENGAGTPADVTLTASSHSKYVPLAAADRDAIRGLRFLKFVTASSQATTDTILTL